MTSPRRADLHVHTSFSDGECGYEEAIDRARAAGLELVALTDHYDPYDDEHPCRSVVELVDFFERARDYAAGASLRLLCGVETCSGPDGELRIGDRAREACDIVIASPHYVEAGRAPRPGLFFDDEYWALYKEKVLRMAASSGADILGHCEGYLPMGPLLRGVDTTFESRRRIEREIAARYFDEDFEAALAEAARASGIAVELHCATETPREEFVARLASAGARLSVGSDAHGLSRIGAIDWGMEMLRKHGREGCQFLPGPRLPLKGKGI